MTTTAQPSLFLKMLATDVSKHVEKKGKFAYLSWSYAVAELRKADPTATWTVVKYRLPGESGGLAPYCQTPAGYFVEVEVTCGGIKLSQVHPVIDERNQTVKTPNAYEVNKAIMRCLVKAIALHGLGLHVYAGEDLPLGDDGFNDPQDSALNEKAVRDALNKPAFDMGPVLDLSRAIIDGDAVALEWARKQIETVTDESDVGAKMTFALESLCEKRGAKLDDVEWAPAHTTDDAVELHRRKQAAAAYLEKKLAERDAEEKVLRIARGGKAKTVDPRTNLPREVQEQMLNDLIREDRNFRRDAMNGELDREHGRYAAEFPNEGRSEG